MATIDKCFIIKNGNELPGDDKLFFHDEPVEWLESPIDMFDIFVRTGIFPSKGQARKNWTRTGAEIPPGFNDFQNIGKLKHRITILNPIKGEEDGN